MTHGQILAASEKSRSGTVMLVLDESFLSEVFTVDIVRIETISGVLSSPVDCSCLIDSYRTGVYL